MHTRSVSPPPLSIFFVQLCCDRFSFLIKQGTDREGKYTIGCHNFKGHRKGARDMAGEGARYYFSSRAEWFEVPNTSSAAVQAEAFVRRERQN